MDNKDKIDPDDYNYLCQYIIHKRVLIQDSFKWGIRGFDCIGDKEHSKTTWIDK